MASGSLGFCGPAGHNPRHPALLKDTFTEAQFRRLENRIDRLDRTVGAAVDLLQAFLHSENADKPGTSAER